MTDRPANRPAARPTMRDVALRAGVGLGTVSRVVNASGAVKPATAARVQAAIDELGFQRDEIARALRPGQHSRTIGLLLGDLTNPFYASLAKAAVDITSRAGYAVVMATVDEDPRAERRAINELIGRRVAGLIIVPDQGNYGFLKPPGGREGTPVVFVDRPANGIDADVVVFDNERGSHLATRHLIDHGHRRIAIVVAPSYYTTGLRVRGYRRALREAGIPVDDHLILKLRHGTTQEATEATRTALALDDPPTAVFSTTNFLTEGVLRVTLPHIRPLAVIGFDDFRLADLLPTPVSVVTADTEELGRRAAQLLLRRIDGDTRAPERIVLPVELIARGSAEIPPADA
ncbi:LacI family DNA-binding transcriptional regulator [Kitasatospora sp. NPDC001603]|uniref:LacI family DNA-binding transcriptional regulator n=1 Tax=Kitasatospora sp. NPDC001603 TaxID=3154388 RepID=UPI00331B7045